MEANPEVSETIVTAEEPSTEPITVQEFKKGRAKREAKRKEVKVITEYVPEAPPATTPLSEAVEVPAPPAVDVDSIADRVAEKLFAKMAVEKVDLDKENTPPNKTKAKPKPPAKKKEKQASPPPTKYFGWC
jgi:hypothetical protein